MKPQNPHSVPDLRTQHLLDADEPTEPPFDLRGPLRSDEAMLIAFEHLLSRASLRQAWMFYFDDEHRLLDPFMPFEDLPSDPLTRADTEDLGSVPFTEVLLDRIHMIMELISAASLAVVWERLGDERFTSDDLHWAREFASHARREGVTVRAQFLLNDSGVRQITPDDYV